MGSCTQPGCPVHPGFLLAFATRKTEQDQDTSNFHCGGWEQAREGLAAATRCHFCGGRVLTRELGLACSVGESVMVPVTPERFGAGPERDAGGELEGAVGVGSQPKIARTGFFEAAGCHQNGAVFCN